MLQRHKLAFLVSKSVVVVDVGGSYSNDDDGKEEEEVNFSESNSETAHFLGFFSRGGRF